MVAVFNHGMIRNTGIFFPRDFITAAKRIHSPTFNCFHHDYMTICLIPEYEKDPVYVHVTKKHSNSFIKTLRRISEDMCIFYSSNAHRKHLGGFFILIAVVH